MITDKQLKSSYKAYVNQYNRDIQAGIHHKENLLSYNAYINVYDSYKQVGKVSSSTGKVLKTFGKGAKLGNQIAKDQRQFSSNQARVYAKRLNTLKNNKEAYKRFLDRMENDHLLKKNENIFKSNKRFEEYVLRAEKEDPLLEAFYNAWDAIREDMESYFDKDALVKWSEGGS